MSNTSPDLAAAKADVKHNAERLKSDGSALIDDLKGHAEEFGDAQKDQFADRVGGIADTLRGTSKKFRSQDESAVAGLTDTAADQLERVSASLRNKDISTMLSEASDLARSHPAIFLGGAVALGFIAGRFLRASSEDGRDDDRDMPATPGA